MESNVSHFSFAHIFSLALSLFYRRIWHYCGLILIGAVVYWGTNSLAINFLEDLPSFSFENDSIFKYFLPEEITLLTIISFIRDGLVTAITTKIGYDSVTDYPQQISNQSQNNLNSNVPNKLDHSAWRDWFIIVFLGFITAMLFDVATQIGTILFIIPGIIIFCCFWVCAPAAISERLGPIKASQRSLQLTRGYRAAIFWFLVVLGLILAALTFLVIYLIGWLNLVPVFDENLVSGIAIHLIDLPITIIFSLLALASYLTLSAINGGKINTNIGEVFR